MKNNWKTAIVRACLLAACGGLLMSVLNGGCGRMDVGSVTRIVHGGGRVIKAASLNEDDEREMGQSVAIAGTNQYGYYSDAALNEYVTLVGLTVAMGSPRPDLNYLFAVLDSDDVQAFSGPGGYVMITRGAIRRMQDEAELAGMLAHEVAHVAKHHGLDAVKQSGILEGAVEAGTAAARLQQFASLADAATDVTLKKGYSRGQESDADAEAIVYLVNTRYDPHGWLDFLKRIEALKSGSNSGGLMSTHPGIHDRIADVAAKIDGLGSTSGQRNRERFMRATAGLRR